MTGSLSPPATTLRRVRMLPEPLALHDVDDLEAFIRAALNEHLATGARTRNGPTGPSTLLPDDYDDLLGDLFEIAAKANRDFNGNGRFSGFLIQRLHWGITNWKRKTFGRTRYEWTTRWGKGDGERHVYERPRPRVEPLTDRDLDEISQHFAGADFSMVEVFDMIQTVKLSHPRRRTLERVVVPIVFHGDTVHDYARRSGKSVVHVRREIAALRRELETRELLVA